MRRVQYLLMAAIAAFCTPAAMAAPAPDVDHHQHVFSDGIVKLLGPEAGIKPLPAKELVPLLDAAGIRRAVLLSTAYMYGSPRHRVADEYAQVRRENDWTAAQAAQFPGRLIAFCGIAPLKAYALEEIRRCAGQPGLKHGIKLHLGNSDVQLDQPEHVARLAQVFAAANREGMAIVVHMRASIRNKRPYGANEARAFLDKVLPSAPDVPVQVAHLGGTGPGFDDPPAQEVLATLAEAVQQRHPATRGLWFDVASMVQPDIKPEEAALLARRLRQIGLDRVLYGTDSARGENLRPRAAWAAFQRLPLSGKEFAQVAGNVAPYFRPEEPAAGTPAN
ncbi:amidohydrolase family protein [Massilia sp. Dwa41.01b]|uniref:amidohydrolase family protein n=1 Tax=unclassified Massilia TaxID=2609279 RepID=UPI001603A94B|nr:MULTISPECIES: amidohydrolase family protein [unclassified Massilia]QNA89135.1 amidohydrolase family protein [Massilia sp. Dwa41.01b]QNB00028.1 amidohydrolase family protein [Massilia sp. Se16.2.3]